MAKYVILINFYVSLIQKYKKHKIQDKKKNLAEHLHHGISNYR